MLTDLLSLERLFGHENAAMHFEALCSKYGEDYVCGAIDKGELVLHNVCIGPDCGRSICWLSDKGRYKAAEFFYQGAIPRAQELVESR